MAWKGGGSSEVDQVLVPHTAIFHAQIHETCRCQIRILAPAYHWCILLTCSTLYGVDIFSFIEHQD